MQIVRGALGSHPSELVVDLGGGNVAARHDYYLFGEEIGSSVGQRSTAQGYDGANSTRTRFAGMERDTSGTDHTPFRRHEAKAGRWTSPDPYGGSQAVADPQSFNWYSYVSESVQSINCQIIAPTVTDSRISGDPRHPESMIADSYLNPRRHCPSLDQEWL